MRMKRSPKVVVAASIALVLAGGAAFAFWTASGIGTGSAATAPDTTPLQIIQAGTTEFLVPGGSVPLHGTITNPNTAPVSPIGLNFTATVTSVTTLVPDGFPPCTAADYVITGSPTITVVGSPTGDIPGLGSATWDGFTLTMLNSEFNQNDCKGATVNIGYSTTP